MAVLLGDLLALTWMAGKLQGGLRHTVFDAAELVDLVQDGVAYDGGAVFPDGA